MKTLLRCLALLLIPVAAQAAPGSLYHQDVRPHIFAQVGNPHQVTLNWTLSTDDTTTACAAPNTCVQNLYRAPGACSTSSVFAIITSPLAAAVSFVDTNVSVGQTYCYQVTFEINALESGPSNQVAATIRPFAPGSLTEANK